MYPMNRYNSTVSGVMKLFWMIEMFTISVAFHEVVPLLLSFLFQVSLVPSIMILNVEV